ncbi:MAG: hypothetical protein L0177_07890 [Chloroflexi bacterium]|nr:hypothetical protein [Chloroflexota bacterium]
MGRILGNIDSDLVIMVVVRVFIGLLLASVLSFIGWGVARTSIPQLQVGSFGSYMLPVVLVGVFAGLGAVAAWWNAENPPRLKLIYSLGIVLFAAVSSVIAFELIRDNVHLRWVPEISEWVPVLYQRDVASATVAGSVLGANLAGVALFLVRALLHREF